ncbi:MAG: cobyric acid synthase, partial [Halolamina sp.]
PVLLKPTGDGRSQIVVQGQARDTVAAGTFYESHWTAAREAARESYERLAAEHDVIVAEGAGSIAEINLAERDLANVETARFADADVLLVGDIERGGVFASLYGTLELMQPDLRERVVGVVVNKFRGDESLLTDGLDSLEERTDVPVLGVVPFDDPGLPEEDSLSVPARGEKGIRGDDDGVIPATSVTIAAPRWPHVSNATDLEPLAAVPGVRVAYVPLDGALADADAVVLPGTKNTVDDLLAAREAGLGRRLRRFDGPIVGICGGYQMLGERITNAAIEGTGTDDEVDGFGVLPVETHFSPEKRVHRATYRVDPVPPIEGVSGAVTGYEIHAGRSSVAGGHPAPIGPASVAVDGVLGTYLHGLFENRAVRDAFVDAVFSAAGRSRPDQSVGEASPYAAAAALIESALDDSFLDGFADR